MKPYLFLFLLLPVLTSCGKHQLEERFLDISALAHAGDNDLIYDHFNAYSQEYFDTLRSAAIAKDPELLAQLAITNEIPVTTYVLYDLLDAPDGADSLMRTIMASEHQLRLALRSNAIGVFYDSYENPIQFQGVTYSGESWGRVSVAVPMMNGLLLGSDYKFTKEDGAWKLDFVSTMLVFEKILAQQQKKSGLSPLEFAQKFNAEERGPIEFRYQRW